MTKTIPYGITIEEAVQRLQAGEVVAIPTETVYGLAGNALDARAVARIFELKARPFFDPLIVHVAAGDQLGDLVTELPETAKRLIDVFWPGPLTLILPKQPVVPDLVTSGMPTVAVRCPNHPVALELLNQVGLPLAAPSANRFGKVSPTQAAHVAQSFSGAIPPILDGGPCAVGVESTVLSLVEPESPRILRPGGVPREALETVIGRIATHVSASEKSLSPGHTAAHYATATPLRWLPPQPSVEPEQTGKRRLGLICLGNPPDMAGVSVVKNLSASGDLAEAAANLFAALRELDSLQLDEILVQPMDEAGLGAAIMDRLRRAITAHDSREASR